MPGVLVGEVLDGVAEKAQIAGWTNPRFSQRHPGIQHATGIQGPTGDRFVGIGCAEQTVALVVIIVVIIRARRCVWTAVGVFTVTKAELTSDRWRRFHRCGFGKRRQLGYRADGSRCHNRWVISWPDRHGGVVCPRQPGPTTTQRP